VPLVINTEDLSKVAAIGGYLDFLIPNDEDVKDIFCSKTLTSIARVSVLKNFVTELQLSIPGVLLYRIVL
jgi:hypothetical protein